jgi:predicted Zn-dependent protease
MRAAVHHAVAALGLIAATALLAGCPATMPRVVTDALAPTSAGKAPDPGEAAASGAPATAPSAASDGGPPAAEPSELRARTGDLNRHRTQGTGLANIPALQDYLNGLMARIQRAGPQPPRYASVFLRSDPGLVAYTTDVGHVYVSLGWIESAESEAEIVALLAHEYGHLSANHLSRNWVGTAGYVALAGTAVRALAQKQGLPAGASLGASAWGEVISPAWSRTQEIDADAIALEITGALGYSYARGPKTFLERIAAWEGSSPAAPAADGGTANLSDTHPDPAKRLEALDQAYRSKAPKRGVDGADAWQAMRDQPEVASALTDYRNAARMVPLLQKNDARGALQLAEALVAGDAPKNAFALTNAGLGFLAAGRLDRMFATLERAMNLPEPGWMPFQIAGKVHVARRQHPEGLAVLERGFERYGRPTSLMPVMIEQYRIAGESGTQGVNKMATDFKRSRLVLECQLSAEFAQACGLANMNEAQRAQLRAEQERQAKAYADKLNQKVERALKGR